MSAKTNDTFYLAAGGLALLGACGWAFFQQSTISDFRTPIQAPSSGGAYEATPVTLTTAESRQWPDSISQSAGPEWVFDVFTPPVIYYDTAKKIFDVRVPVPPKIGDDYVVPTSPASFGLTLVKVTQPLFRLQLVGHMGEGAAARGYFENQRTGEIIFVGTTGKKLPDLNLEIVRFSAERRRIPVDGGTELVVTEATAVVRDTITGVETALDERARTPEGPMTVTLKKVDGTEVVAKSGDVLTIGENTFTIGSLQLTPPSASVTKSGGKLAKAETETLVIPPPPPPPPADGVEPGAVPPDSPFAPPLGAKPAPGGFPGF